ncbi:D-2-hydroxyacid dehydrogenase family protein [Martelella sp. FOR1707]
MRIHILDDWFNTLPGLPGFSLLSGHDVTIWTDHAHDEAVLAERLKDAEALVLFRERTAITRSLLERLPSLRLIAQRGAYPHIDIVACSDHNVLVCSGKGGGEPNVAAAELTFSLMLAALRDLPGQMASAKAGLWQTGVGRTAKGLTIGLYGYGRIARLVAHYARAFGMTVVWWASPEGREKARGDGEMVAESRAAFFAESDVVSLHLRLTPETRGAITAEDLGLMKPYAVLVNTARAGLIAPGVLKAALDAGRPGLAAVDVFDREPLTDPDDPLLSHPRLIATPHIGFVTEHEFETQFREIYEQIIAYADGAPINMINPQVWSAGPSGR